MLVSEAIAERLVKAACITTEDAVLEIGTGTGVITKLLADRARRVLTWEIDEEIFHSTKRTLDKLGNVTMRCGDAFSDENDSKFDVCVTSLPYSESLRFMKWLSARTNIFKHCVAIVQSEFASKLTSNIGMKSYRAVSVIAQDSFHIERLFPIANSFFYPRPRVLSEAVKFTPKQDSEEPFFSERRVHVLNQLFSFRGRLLSSAMKKTGYSGTLPEHLLNSRIENLPPELFAEIILKLEVLPR